MDLLEEVLRAFDGHVPRKYVRQGDDGTTSEIEYQLPWLDWWTGQPYHRSYLTAVQLLAAILAEVRQRQHISPAQEHQVLDHWTHELRAGVTQGRIRPHTPDSLLPLDSAPDGWRWSISTTDADAWLAEQGAGWNCGEIIGSVHRRRLNSRLPPIQCGQDDDEAVVQETRTAEPPRTPRTKNTKWTLEQLQALLNESETKTQSELASIHGLSRQRIGKLLRDAKEAVGAAAKTDLARNPLATLVKFRNKK